tara:strand:- start:77 stop:583 length:507 start_codon:yes stop_codon:yes gene_type:complete
MLQQLFNHPGAPGFQSALHIPDLDDDRTHPSWDHNPLSLPAKDIKCRPLQNLGMVLSFGLVAIALHPNRPPKKACKKERSNHRLSLGDPQIGILKTFQNNTGIGVQILFPIGAVGLGKKLRKEAELAQQPESFNPMAAMKELQNLIKKPRRRDMSDQSGMSPTKSFQT